MDVRTKPTPGPSTEAMQPIRRTTPGMLAKKRAQVASDRAKAKSFREERVPLLARLGEVDALVRKYDWSVEMGAVAVVEMIEQMKKEEAEDRRLQIAAEARGNWATASTDTAGPSRPTASSRGNAPRANNTGTVKHTGTIPKYRDRVWVAQEERERHRSACGYRGGAEHGPGARVDGVGNGPEAVHTTTTPPRARGTPMGTG